MFFLSTWSCCAFCFFRCNSVIFDQLFSLTQYFRDIIPVVFSSPKYFTTLSNYLFGPYLTSYLPPFRISLHSIFQSFPAHLMLPAFCKWISGTHCRKPDDERCSNRNIGVESFLYVDGWGPRACSAFLCGLGEGVFSLCRAIWTVKPYNRVTCLTLWLQRRHCEWVLVTYVVGTFP